MKVYKNARTWTCKYCGQQIVSRDKLYKHYKDCTEKAKLPKDSLGRVITEEQRIALRNADHSHKGYKLSEKAKKNISEGRLKSLREGRGNHWICPHIKRSYAEQYFYDAFQNAKLEFNSNIWLCRTILRRLFSW